MNTLTKPYKILIIISRIMVFLVEITIIILTCAGITILNSYEDGRINYSNVFVFSFLASVIELAILSPLIRLVRPKKITSAEKLLRKNINNINGMLEKKMISQEEAGSLCRKSFERNILKKLANSKTRTLEYKIERFSSLKEEKIISEDEFKEAKKQLIEKAG